MKIPDSPAPASFASLVRTRSVRLVLLVELVVAAMVVYGLWTLRQQTLDSELRMLASLSAAMAVQADSTLGVAEAVLSATRTELRDRLVEPGGLEAQGLLRARANALPMFRALVIFDAQGQRVATSRANGGPGGSVAERDFFLAARQAPEPRIFIGTPFVSRADGKVSTGVSMDWRDREGQFKGVVVLVAEAEFLEGGFGHIAPEPDVTLGIYRQDGQLVSDGPGDDRAHLLPPQVTDALWSDASPERPTLTTLPDGHQRLVAAHRVSRFPLMVVVARDAEAALESWTRQAWLVGAFAASALVTTLLLTLRNGREQVLRHAAQAALAADQARALRAFQAAQEGHWEWNPLTHESHLSPRMKELLGLGLPDPVETEGAVGWLDLDHLHPDDVGPLRDAFQTHQQGLSPVFDCTFRVRHADGQWHHVRSRGHAWREADGQVTLFSGTGIEVTHEVEAQRQQQQLEDQLHRARKLEALGTLAGGVAHDFNNILAAVLGYGEMARHAATEGSGQARHLDHVLQAGQRGKALVERILSFSRGAPRARTVFRLEPVIDEVLQLLAASLPSQVVLERRLQAPDAAIAGDATQVYEAAMNLCTNAMQAMPQGGALCVELITTRLERPLDLFDRSLAPGHYARLSVTDSGIGIPPEVMGRLFEPFFTTKGPHQGTGLGLAVVHGVMADLGGAIDVRNMPGQGACFTLYFPCVAAVPEDAEVIDRNTPRGQGQTVLVVDDEPALVELAEELLAGLGYEPIGFTSSLQALEAFRCDPGRFDLVLTDEVMPGMTGTALADALHAVRPGLPIVLASGYGGPQLESRAATAGVTVLLKKPLVRAELARAVAQALPVFRHAEG